MNLNTPRSAWYLTSLISIWKDPRATIRNVVQTVPLTTLIATYVVFLAIFMGLMGAPAGLFAEGLVPGLTVMATLIPISVGGKFLFAWLFAMGGNWMMGARTTAKEAFYAVIWPGLAGGIVIFLILLVAMILFRLFALCGASPDGFILMALPNLAVLCVSLASIATIAINILCLSEVARLSIIRTCALWAILVVLFVVATAFLGFEINMFSQVAAGAKSTVSGGTMTTVTP